MADRTLRLLILTTALTLANLSPARSEPIPAPTDALKDFRGIGVIQLDIAGTGTRTTPDGKEAKVLSYSTWFDFAQGYVRPDRMLIAVKYGGTIQRTLISGQSEMVYSPGAGYVLKRTFKNIDPNAPSPMTSSQLSMATYARVLRELTSGKVLPDEDLDKLKIALTSQIEALRVVRDKLTKADDPTQIDRATEAAAEQARLRSDLDQIDLRRAHPCHIVEFPNKDLSENLLSRGLVTDANMDFINKGKTTVWLTKAEGLPIKIETRANDGRMAIFFCFSQLKINEGLLPSELGLGYPPGTRLLAATADLRDKNWQEKMEKEVARQVEMLDRERQRENTPPSRVPLPKKGK